VAQQCLDRRIPSVEKRSSELTAWHKEHNCTTSKVVWQFTTEDARLKLKHLYPVFETSESEDSNAPN
jgi:hypothetical protein